MLPWSIVVDKNLNVQVAVPVRRCINKYSSLAYEVPNILNTASSEDVARIYH